MEGDDTNVPVRYRQASETAALIHTGEQGGSTRGSFVVESGSRAYTASCRRVDEERGRGFMTEQDHGRYYAQELVLDPNADGLWQIQEALDAGDRREWHLLGVSNVLPERGVILFWDTERPSFGISQRRS